MAETQTQLWVCHRCKMIGSDAEAERHVTLTGHRVEQLDQDTSDAVRAEMTRLASDDMPNISDPAGRSEKAASDEERS